MHEPIPADWPVQPLKPGDEAKDKVTCGHCLLSWDDAITTSMTPAPSARCPFEAFHISDEEVEEPIDILAIQQRFLDAGFQFQERVLQNGFSHIKVDRSFDRYFFATPGLFEQSGITHAPRIEAWQMIAEWLDKWEASQD